MAPGPDVAPPEPDSEPPKDVVDWILAANRATYTRLAPSYCATADLRAHDAPKLLEPVLATARERNEREPTSALELGCADGVFTSWLARNGLSVTVVEYADKMRRAAKERFDADRVPQGQVRILPHEFHNGGVPLPALRDRTFDVVIAMAFVHLFPAGIDLAVLRQIRAHLAPRGVAFLTTTVEHEDQRGFVVKQGPHGSQARYRSRYQARTFLDLVESAGFTVLDKEYVIDSQMEGKTWLDVIVGHAGE